MCKQVVAFVIASFFPLTAMAGGEYESYSRYLDVLALSDPKPSVANIAGGFGASQGTVYAAVSYTNYDMQTQADGDDDGSIAVGLGFGDPINIAGELTIGITSVSTAWWGDGQFADEGNVSIKAHRYVPALLLGHKASMSIGASNFAGWGMTRENPVNYYAAYSEIAYFGDFDQYGLMYSIGYGTGISELETSSDVFWGVGIGYDDYSVSVSQIGSETHLTGMIYFPRYPEVAVAISVADSFDQSDAQRSIVSLSYAKKLF
ncbi:hypothetical protein [Yoonia sp.]|uniref:hypothetical protein n=1 Tax=Yoonia sp. TaxID=2212373 RepID=UPI004048997B